eukprot:scaffold114802_cov72-Attheya_sp.AAC.2
MFPNSTKCASVLGNHHGGRGVILGASTNQDTMATIVHIMPSPCCSVSMSVMLQCEAYRELASSLI